MKKFFIFSIVFHCAVFGFVESSLRGRSAGLQNTFIEIGVIGQPGRKASAVLNNSAAKISEYPKAAPKIIESAQEAINNNAEETIPSQPETPDNVNISESPKPEPKTTESARETINNVTGETIPSQTETSNSLGAANEVLGCRLSGSITNGSDNGAEALIILEDIRIKMLKYIRYPRIAARQGIEGEAVLSFLLESSGKVEKAEVFKSSGSRILDDEALRMLNAAQPFNISGIERLGSILVKLPIKFALNREQ
jgi:protein TonB